ncbi:DUF5977 domain-containing protein [Pedobacter nototheniae]|uniref:DUF5977 domain-containing protein n=1 Tax=Pedobacter nototheniae TaxID=2488994 RepID=UPI00103FA05E|nr:DUF5977 domain-containing protein [Pedobacter nototheniae]
MNKRILFSLMLALLFCKAFAQDRTNYLRTDLISPSPTAAGITRYGDISVNPSSGSANLSIPIFNVQGLELSLPISLGYGYSGLRSAENAGWAGLGWTLQSGGVITRNIRGKVDRDNDAGGFSSDYVSNKIYNGLNNSDSEDFQTFLENVYNGNYDAEPDVYSFNFPGHSGKFIIYKGVTYCYPDQKLKIIEQIGAFVIITEDGTNYLFSATETTRSKGNANAQYNLPPYISAYYLTKIQNAALTESIDLNYTQEAEITQMGPLTQTYKKYSTFYDESILYDPVNSYPTFVAPLRLTQISSEKFTVNFLPEVSPRLDLKGINYAIGGISVVDKDALREIKYFKFNHSYFGDNAFLKLTSLEENIGGDLHGTSSSPLIHNFEYEESFGFPIKPTLGADHFGYYNGSSSSILIPSSIYPSGPNREPNLSFTKQGALKKITYPTGGYTTFTYEGNVAFDGRNYKKKDIGITAKAFVQGTDVVPFVLETAQEIRIEVDRYPLTTWGDGNIRGETDFEVRNSITGEKVMFGRVVSENANPPFTQVLPAGSYFLYAMADRYENELRATVNYTRTTDIPLEGKVVGGIRVRSVKDFPLIGLSTVKEYKYTDADGFSTGTSNPTPVYHQSNITEVIEEPTGYRTRNAVIYSSSISESDYYGVQDYYQSVTETNTSVDNKLVVRSDYSMNNYFNAQPHLTQTTVFKSLSSGLLQPIKRTVMNYMAVFGNSITSVRPEQTFEVILNRSGPAWGYPGPLKQFAPITTQYNQGWEYVLKSSEINYFGTDSVKNESINIYDPVKKNLQMTRQLSADGGIVVTKYKYADNYVPSLSAPFLTANVTAPVWEKQLWKKTLTDSVLIASTVTLFNNQFRPTDIYTMDATGIHSLNSEFRSAGLYNTVISDTRLSPKAHFYYDAVGHLVHQKQENGPSMAYKWGYGTNTKHYPIAEAKNASDSEIFTENFEDISNESTGNAHTGNRFHNGNYLVNWITPNAKPYLIDYYFLTGSGWQYKTEPFISGNHSLSGGTAYDDIRVFPSDAQITTYTYNTGIGISSIIDTKGLTQFYEYDSFNKLENIKDGNGNILKNNKYNFRVADGRFYNTETSAVFYRNNCGTGVSGSGVFYTIAAGSYVSSLSQADADAQATAALQLAGQANANAKGTCGETILISFVNETGTLPSSGAKSGNISSVEFRNTVSKATYIFNQEQVNAGIRLPKGIYNIDFEITGGKYSESLNLGWSLLTLSYGNSIKYLDFYSDYYMRNVDLNLNSATLKLSAKNEIE